MHALFCCVIAYVVIFKYCTFSKKYILNTKKIYKYGWLNFTTICQSQWTRLRAASHFKRAMLRHVQPGSWAACRPLNTNILLRLIVVGMWPAPTA